MSKRNMWLGLGAVVIIAAVVVFLLVHKSKNNDNTASGNSSQTSSNSGNSNKSTSSEIVVTKTDPTAGEFLADGNGKPLYTYGADSAGVSNCLGACLDNWPIYGPVSTPSSLPANVTIITRSDGKAQYAYKGMPLYYFSNDGSTPTGDGIGDFHLAKP